MTPHSPRLSIRQTWPLAVAAALVLLTGCKDRPLMGQDGVQLTVTQRTELPPPSGDDLVAATTPYRIGPLDKINVAVFGVPDLSGKFQTDAAGRLSLPLVGSVDASGQTPTELSDRIAGRLKGRFVRNPQVTVNLEETTSQVFTVDGQVSQPGSYPIVGNMSLMKAVATAKGASEFARMEDVVVFRTIDGKRFAALYNLDAIRRGAYPDPQIYANDLIIVGDSQAKRKMQQFVQVAPLLTTPLILALEHWH